MEYLNKSMENLEKEAENLLKSMKDKQESNEKSAQTDTKSQVATKDNLENNSEDKKQTSTESSNIKKSLDSINETGDFLNSVTTAISNIIEKSELNKSLNQNNESIGILAKSLVSISKAQSFLIDEQNKSNELYKSLSEKIDDISNKIINIEKQPMTRKSIDNINIIERNLNKSVNGGNISLTKSQIATVLNEEFYKGNPSVSEQDIISFESGVPLRADLQQLVLNKSQQLNIV